MEGNCYYCRRGVLDMQRGFAWFFSQRIGSNTHQVAGLLAAALLHSVLASVLLHSVQLGGIFI